MSKIDKRNCKLIKQLGNHGLYSAQDAHDVCGFKIFPINGREPVAEFADELQALGALEHIAAGMPYSNSFDADEVMAVTGDLLKRLSKKALKEFLEETQATEMNATQKAVVGQIGGE